MGYMNHHAIICTSWDWNTLALLHEDARKIFKGNLVSPIIEGVINKYSSFMVAPDGSKEGWAESDMHDKLRAKFVAQIKKYNNDDDSCAIDWVEVFFDENGTRGISNVS